MNDPAPKDRAVARRLGATTMELVVLTDRTQARGDLVGVVGAAVEGGARVVLLREKDLPWAQRRALATSLLDTLAAVDGMLLVASDVELARQVGADGVHLASDDPWPNRQPRPHPEDLGVIVGRSCHTAAELGDARRHEADYATISPVFPTTSKPGYGPALGVEGLASACRALVADDVGSAQATLPVIALGGVGPGRVGPCLGAGAAGVAVMGEVMRAADPAGTVRTLLGELRAHRRPVTLPAEIRGEGAGGSQRWRRSLEAVSERRTATLPSSVPGSAGVPGVRR